MYYGRGGKCLNCAVLRIINNSLVAVVMCAKVRGVSAAGQSSSSVHQSDGL